MSTKQKNPSIWLYIAVTGLLWAGMETALKSVSGQFHPIQLTFSRVLTGGLILIPLALGTMRRRGERFDRRSVWMLFGLSLLGVTFSICVTQFAVLLVPAAVVSAIASTNPIFAVILSFLVFRERIERHHVVSIVFALLAIVLIVRPWGVRLSPIGLVLAILSPLSFSLYSVCGRTLTKRYGGVVVTCVCFLLGAAEMMLGAALTHIPAVAQALAAVGLEGFAQIPFLSGYSLSTLPAVIYIFVGGTGIGFACYFLAIEKGSVQQASVVYFVKPILAPVIAWAILRETIRINEFAGIICVICAALALVGPDMYHSLRRCTNERNTEAGDPANK